MRRLYAPGAYDEPEDDPNFMTPDEYRGFLVDRLADVVEKAWEDREPGAISRGFAYAVVGRCRRAVYRDGSAQMYGATDREDFLGIEACDDHAVNLLFTHDVSGELTGVLVNLACPSQCDERKEEFSADFWHDVREGLHDRCGPAVHLLPQCAPAGDASPHLLLDQREEKDLRDRAHVDDKGIIARRIMTAVEEAQALASRPEREVEFRHIVRTLHLPRLRVTPEEYEMEKKIPTMSEEELKRQPWGFNRIWPFGSVSDLVSRYENQDENPTHHVECHIIRLGDAVLRHQPLRTLHGLRHPHSRPEQGAANLPRAACGRVGERWWLPSDAARTRRRPLQCDDQVHLGRPRRRPDARGRDACEHQ